MLTPEGAAIHPRDRSAVIADVHLGYEWARAAAGDCVPAHSFEETVERLSRVLAHIEVTRLIIAGDLVESVRPCQRTVEDVRRLRHWLGTRGVALLVLEGNHDRGLFTQAGAPAATSSATTGGSRLPASYQINGWTIAHGHRPIVGQRTVSGHLHPVLRAEGLAAPCFLADPDRIVLPAFSANAAGCDVLSGPIPADWLEGSLRCIASTGSELLDFGLLRALRRRRSGSPA